MLLKKYLKEIGLPNPTIESQGHVSKAFLKHGITTLWDAIAHVNQSPYGRTRNRENYLQVLEEGKGVCSNKHALLAALTEELEVPLKLTLGIYLITPKNTPKISPILEHYHLQAIPEAHSYLKYNNHTLDITFPNATAFALQVDLEKEIEMNSHQIGAFKMDKHKAFIKTWIKDKPDLSLDLIWIAREEWIEKLTQDEANVV